MPNGRDKRRARAERGRRAEAARVVCPNCGGKGRHFIPPSLGEPGFYACPNCPVCGEYGPRLAHLIEGRLGEPSVFSCGPSPELALRSSPIDPKVILTDAPARSIIGDRHHRLLADYLENVDPEDFEKIRQEWLGNFTPLNYRGRGG